VNDRGDVALASEPFDEEGLPFRRTRWIDGGTLAALMYTRYWGQKQGKPPTGYPGGFHLHGGTTPRAELVKGLKRGLLVTRFFYTSLVDPQTILATGMTRDGVFLVENGEVVAPVNNLRWSASPLTMLERVEAMSPAEVAPNDFGFAMRVPALRTADFHFTSVSEAV
jgi:predicted Zn-dependent protease